MVPFLGFPFIPPIPRANCTTTRLYREVISSRMRPFRDGVQGLPRLVRDMARQLGKKAQLEIQGETTEVDRDILQGDCTMLHVMRGFALIQKQPSSS